MGCLNSEGKFEHWFGNIHLSGPCNRACPFCIGQHMMSLDSYNNLNDWPLLGIDEFLENCITKGVEEINVTGTNTDPLLFTHSLELREKLEENIPNLLFGLRTNGVLALAKPEIWKLYNKASITVCSFDSEVYKKMMGRGKAPNIEKILENSDHMKSIKLNVVLGPENTAGRTHNEDADVYKTLEKASQLGIKRVNLREPYGQPHVGDPLKGKIPQLKTTLGMPTYLYNNVEVTWWDVHYVEVESVNLYASGKVSLTYPITLGHDDNTGKVLSQKNFPGGRVQEQWLNQKRNQQFPTTPQLQRAVRYNI